MDSGSKRCSTYECNTVISVGYRILFHITHAEYLEFGLLHTGLLRSVSRFRAISVACALVVSARLS